MGEQIKLYHAAAMFSGRETFFNARLVAGLEEKGYAVISPQRDGFDFVNLKSALENRLNPDEVGPAVCKIIYLLDIGFLIPRSHVTLANLDEPFDEGVGVEISYARIMGRPVIGYRTDLRGPYSPVSSDLGGIHVFPCYQCNAFIRHYMPGRTLEEAEANMQELVDKIDNAIKGIEIPHPVTFPSSPYPEGITLNKHIKISVEGAADLFRGINDIHSEEGLGEIAQRYISHKNELDELFPQVLA